MPQPINAGATPKTGGNEKFARQPPKRPSTPRRRNTMPSKNAGTAQSLSNEFKILSPLSDKPINQAVSG
jgi:hypothetical protein